MGRAIRYAFIAFSIILLFTIITILVNLIITISIPFVFKPVGQADAWIQYYGSIIGSLFGGAIGGYVALLIAKFQIVEMRNQAKRDRNDSIRNELEIKTTEQMLDIIINFDMVINRDCSLLKRLTITSMRFIEYHEQNHKQPTYFNDLKGDFKKFSEQRTANITEFYQLQSRYLSLSLGRSIVFEGLYDEINNIGQLYVSINKSCHAIEYYLNNVKSENKEMVNGLINQYNQHMNICKNLIKQIRELSNKMQNTYLSAIFGGRTVKQQPFRDEYKTISWDDIE